MTTIPKFKKMNLSVFPFFLWGLTVSATFFTFMGFVYVSENKDRALGIVFINVMLWILSYYRINKWRKASTENFKSELEEKNLQLLKETISREKAEKLIAQQSKEYKAKPFIMSDEVKTKTEKGCVDVATI